MANRDPLPYSPPRGGYQRRPPGVSKSRNRRRRNQLITALLAKHGFVPCFVCGLNVERDDATIEHIVPKSRGGGSNKKNLSISHRICNERRGAPDVGAAP